MTRYTVITIPINEAVSNELDLSGVIRDGAAYRTAIPMTTPSVIGVVPPDTLDSGTVSLQFEASMDGETFYVVKNFGGDILKIDVDTSENSYRYGDIPTALTGALKIRVRTVDGSGADVPQTAERSVGFVVVAV